MIKKVTLEKVSRFTKDKEGKPFKTKDGKNYERVLLTVNGKTLSGFGAQWNQDWKAGDEVQIDITEVPKDGKVYYNFGQVNITSQLIVRIEAIEKAVKHLQDELLTSDGHKVPDFSEVDSAPTEAPDEIKGKDYPF